MASLAEILNLAAEYHATGNSVLAEQYAARVLEEEPNHAEALHLLGLIAQQKGMLNEAMAFLRRSLTADGSNASVWQHAGDLLLARGDVSGGITYYEQALRLRPDFAEGHNTLGAALMRVGKWAQAADCFQQARRLAPSFAPALNNLGLVLNKQGKWAEAAAVFEEALKLRPDIAEIAYNLANARFHLGDLDEAIASYRRALHMKPGNAAEVCIGLATALRTRGHWDEAISSYKEALRLRPGHGLAIYHLSEMAAQGRYVFPPEELGDVKEVLIAGHCGEEDRRMYSFAVGNVLHRQAAYDEAFRYYREANDLLMHFFKKRNAAFNARAHRATFDKIMAEQGQSYFEKVKGWGTPAELPVFLVGMPCSGTALVEEVLATHPKVSRVGEVGNVTRFLAQSTANNNSAPNTAQLLLDLHATQKAAAMYLQHLTQLGPGAARVLVNSIDNVQDLGMIATLFSGVRVIHCRREPLDIGLACYLQNRREAFTCSLEDIGAYSRAHDKLMAHWALMLPLTIHEVNFEALIQDREKTARALIAYCGLDWDESCATVPTASGNASTSDSGLTGISSAVETIGQWRHYRDHLGPLIKALEGC